MNTCDYCGQPARGYDIIGNQKVYHCDSNECLSAIEYEHKMAYQQAREEAIEEAIKRVDEQF